MKTVVAGLKWCAKYLENRFPEKVDLSNFATKDEVSATRSSIANLAMELEALKAKYEEQKKLNELLSLRVGLSRPMQTILQKH